MKKLFVIQFLMLIAGACHVSDTKAESFTITKSGEERLSNFFPETSRYFITELKVIGEINTADINFIRGIAQGDGNLANLDLSEVTFVDADGLGQLIQDYNIKSGTWFDYYSSISTFFRQIPYFWQEYSSNSYCNTYIGYYIVYSTSGSTLKFSAVQRTGFNIIPNHMFRGCNKLETVVLPPHITDIGKYAFYECKNLVEVSIPSNVCKIGECAFQGCVKLREIQLPQTLTSIGTSAFDGCISLSSIVIPDNVKSLGSYIFSGCTELKTAKLSDNIETVPFGLFYKCKNLKSVNIPKNSVEIRTYAFYQCGMDSIFLYDKLNRIGTNVFDGCPLKCVYITAEMPPSCETKPFFQSGKGRTLYVPLGCVERYSLSPAWKEFEFIIEMSELNNKKCEKPTISYKNNKLFFYSNTEDVSFVSTISDTDIKMYNSNLIELSATYNITVYAKKNGYEDSEITTATLCWIDVDPKTEGLSNDVAQVRANAVLIQSMDGQIAISGIDDGTRVSAYKVNGQQVGSTISHNGLANLTTNLRPGSIVIIKIGDRSVKTTIK